MVDIRSGDRERNRGTRVLLQPLVAGRGRGKLQFSPSPNEIAVSLFGFAMSLFGFAVSPFDFLYEE